MKLIKLKRFTLASVFLFTSNLLAADKDLYLYCQRQANPPTENVGSHDWQYEELEVSVPKKLQSGEWNVKIGSGYFDLTDLGAVLENSFNIRIFHINAPYDVIADTEDPFGTLKGAKDPQGNWKVRFKATTWKKTETLNCSLSERWMFKSAEQSWQ